MSNKGVWGAVLVVLGLGHFFDKREKDDKAYFGAKKGTGGGGGSAR